jgi:hypothetical protein
MRVSQITITKGLTVNLGNYNSAKIEVGLVADLDPGEHEGEIYAAVDEQVTEWLKESSKTVKGVKFEPVK